MHMLTSMSQWPHAPLTYKVGGGTDMLCHMPLRVRVMYMDTQFLLHLLLHICDMHTATTLGQYISVSRQLSRPVTVPLQFRLARSFPARCTPFASRTARNACKHCLGDLRCGALAMLASTACRDPRCGVLALHACTHSATVAPLLCCTIACNCNPASMQVVDARTIRLQVVHVVCKSQYAARTPSRSHGAAAWQ